MSRRLDPAVLGRGASALITGASSGIGAGFAAALAARGMDLVITARRADRLGELARVLAHTHGVHVETIVADLSQNGDVQRVAETFARRPVDVLINNAGFGTHGSFAAMDARREADEIAVNCGALVALAHAAVPPMSGRGRGAIVNVASTAAFQGIPYMAVYGATKAFVLSFSTGLAGELASHGIGVLALCPGATETEFFGVTGEGSQFASRRTVDDVVATALRALERGRSVAVDGRMNAVTAAAPRLLPRSLMTRLAGAAMRPRSNL